MGEGGIKLVYYIYFFFKLRILYVIKKQNMSPHLISCARIGADRSLLERERMLRAL